MSKCLKITLFYSAYINIWMFFLPSIVITHQDDNSRRAPPVDHFSWMWCHNSFKVASVRCRYFFWLCPICRYFKSWIFSGRSNTKVINSCRIWNTITAFVLHLHPFCSLNVPSIFIVVLQKYLLSEKKLP